MKRTIRIIAMLLALITLSSVLAACAQTGNEDTTATPDVTTAPTGEVDATEAATTAEITLYEPDSLKEKYDFGETITIFMWADYRMTEFYAEETGDIIDDSIYHRNIKVGNRLGVTFEFVEENGDSGDYQKWIQIAENDRAADNAFDIYAGYSRTLPMMSIKGMTVNLLEYDAFNVEKLGGPRLLPKNALSTTDFISVPVI